MRRSREEDSKQTCYYIGKSVNKQRIVCGRIADFK